MSAYDGAFADRGRHGLRRGLRRVPVGSLRLSGLQLSRLQLSRLSLLLGGLCLRGLYLGRLQLSGLELLLLRCVPVRSVPAGAVPLLYALSLAGQRIRQRVRDPTGCRLERACAPVRGLAAVRGALALGAQRGHAVALPTTGASPADLATATLSPHSSSQLASIR